MKLDPKQAIIPGGSFTWGEYAFVKGFGDMLIPSKAQRDNAVFLFTQLQPLRRELGRPLIITSGARSEAYTLWLKSKGIPAALKSAHNEWRAVDITCPGLDNKALWGWFNSRWPGRMEALAHTPGWVHLDTRQWGQRVRFNP